MKFHRGFKSECERHVAQFRSELKLSDDEPIHMEKAATHLEIPVIALREFLARSGRTRNDAAVAEIYSKVSAFTIFNRSHRTIVYNEEHLAPRHRSNLAHELSHALLQHPARNSGLLPEQEKLHEEEARWMGGVLMLTAKQAWRIASERMPHSAAEAQFLVSPEMLRYRLNVTGATRAPARA